MDPVLFKNLVKVQSAPARRTSTDSFAPLTPAQTSPEAQKRDAIELQAVAQGLPLGTVPASAVPVPVAAQVLDTPDLEMSRPASPTDLVRVIPSLSNPSKNWYRLASACLCNFTNALSDGAAGALIPYMEEYYKITYGVVALIFVGQAIGFLVSAALIDTLLNRLGRARLLALSQACFVTGFLPAVCTAPFPLVAIGFSLVGFAIGVNVGIANIFGGSLQNGTFILGLVHGCYGVGGTTGPLIATAMVTVAQALWSRYYLLTLGMGAITIGLSTWSFWGYEKEPLHQMPGPVDGQGSSAIHKMLATLRLRVVLLGSLFIFAYQGAEVSISGWVISFLINARGGDPGSVGYVTAGFWAGITIGRFVLSGPAQRIGEKKFVYGLTIGAAAFQLLVWFVPNIVGEAVAVSIVGLLLGPVYPCAAAVFMKRMSRREALRGMGTISAFGSMGGAVAPFITGLLAQVAGTFVLHPIAIFLFCVMLICWYCIPDEERKDE